MEFPGIGTLSYDPPAEDLREFFKRKHLVWIRNLEVNKNGVIHRDDVFNEVRQVVAQDVPKEKREQVIKERTDVWEWVIMFNTPKDSITEEEVADTWVARAYASPEERKKHMEKNKQYAIVFFSQMDLNKNGVIEFSEWQKGTKILGDDAVKLVFDTIDADKDGVISQQEWTYAILCCMYSSGPDNPISHMFGQVPDN